LSLRISDLSKQTGIPIATIKFYLREGFSDRHTWLEWKPT